MRVSAFVAVSLDGYFCRGSAHDDWLQANGARTDYGFGRFLDGVDAILVGRRTFERLAGYRHWPYGRRRMFVMSSRYVDVPIDLVRFVEPTRLAPQAVLDRLLEEGHRHVFVDGGMAIQSVLKLGRLNDITVTRVPLILGEGLPLFAPGIGEHVLEHLASTAFSDGMVQSRYRIPSATIP